MADAPPTALTDEQLNAMVALVEAAERLAAVMDMPVSRAYRFMLETVTKKFVLFGAHKDLPQGAIVALNGEAGLQADTLPPGMHYLLWPWQYAIDIVKFVTVPGGQVATVKTASGNADAKRLEADADAHVTKVNGEAEAGRTLAVGQAEARVIKEKTDALEAGNYASIEVAKHLSNSKVPIVPGIVAGGGDGKNGSIIDVVIAQMVAAGLKGNGKSA